MRKLQRPYVMRSPLRMVLLCLACTLTAPSFLKSDCLADLSYLKDCLSAKDTPYLKKALHRYTVSGKKETKRMLERLPVFEVALSQALAEEGIPDWLKYITLAESRLQTNAVSPAGAAGLWQIMPRTGRSLGLAINDQIDERLDTRKASRAAAHYLKQLHHQFGDWLLALAAYNCGAGNVRKAQRKAHGYFYHEISLYLPRQTRRYIPRVLTIAKIAQQPHAFGFTVIQENTPLVAVTVHTESSLNEIATYYCMSPQQLSFYNQNYLAGVITQRQIPARIVIPSMAFYSGERVSVLRIGQHLQEEATIAKPFLSNEERPSQLYDSKMAFLYR